MEPVDSLRAAPSTRAVRTRRRVPVAAALLLSTGFGAQVVGDSAAQAVASECMSTTATIVGTGLGDTIVGTAGDDVISGLGGGDQIDGAGGNDIICGGASNDVISGGDGNDSIDAGPGGDIVNGGDGDDAVLGSGGIDSLRGDSGDDRMDGGATADSLYGGPGKDLLRGGDGNDSISGEADQDDLNGDAGRDTIDGGTGSDRADAGVGNDFVQGGDGNDRLYGGDGDDAAYGGPGDDVLGGQAGRDSLVGEAGRDSLDGGDGNDTVVGGDGPDFVGGGTGRDTVTGDGDNDIVDGGPDPDTMDGGLGSDTCRQETVENTIANCERLNDSSRYETETGVRQWVTAGTETTVTWGRYSMKIPAAALSRDCWAAITRLPTVVSGSSGEEVTGMIDFDIDCPWTGTVELGAPVDDAATIDDTAFMHYDDLADTWNFVQSSRIENGIAYATVDKLSPWDTYRAHRMEIAYCTVIYHARACAVGYALSRVAAAKRVNLFGADVDDDKGNAFKHCYWNGLMAAALGAATAKTLGDNHEGFGPDYNYNDNSISDLHHRMDLHNNAYGRAQAADPITGCLRMLNQGYLWYLPSWSLGQLQSTTAIQPITPLSLQFYEPFSPIGVPSGRTIILSRGTSAQGRDGCSVSACAYMAVSASGLPANTSVTVQCRASDEGVFYTYYVRTASNGTLSTAACYYGLPGRTVSVVVAGSPSNYVRW